MKHKLQLWVMMLFSVLLSINQVWATSTEVYHETFEGNDYTTSTTYNNSEEALHGPTNYKWGILCGTPYASGHNGSKSIAMRHYNSVSKTPTLTQKFDVQDVNSISFWYKSENTNNTMTVEYSIDGGTSWIEIESSIALTTEYKQFTKTFDSQLEKIRLRISLVASVEKKSLWIDDIVFEQEEGSGGTTYTDYLTECGEQVNEAPAITSQPVGAEYVQNATATDLTVAATGTPAPTYQWYSNTTNSNENGTLIQGATSASYTPSTATAGTFHYYCVATNSEGSAKSNVVVITVNEVYAVSLNQPTGATIKATPASGIAGTQVTLSYENVAEHYHFDGWTVMKGETPVDVTDNKFTMPAGNVMVSATFAEDAKHNAEFYVNGTQLGETQNLYVGAAITFPVEDDVTVPEGYEFMGWYGDTYSHATEAPTYVTEATMGDADITYHAVFAIAEGGTKKVISMTATSMTDDDQEVLVVCAKGDGNNDPAGSGNVCRVYANNTITISTSGADNITAISLVFHKQGSKDYATTISANSGTYTSGGVSTSGDDHKTDTWSGSAKSVVLTLGSSGQRVLESVTVTLGESNYVNYCTTAIVRTVTGISLNTDVAKKNYKVGDKLSLAGLKLNVTYSSGDPDVIATGFTASPANNATLSDAGVQTITLSYKEQETSTTVNVLALEKIEVTTEPNIVTYEEGERFNPTGMVVTATWGTEEGEKIVEEVNNNYYTMTPSTSTDLQTTNDAIEISYTHQGTTKTTTQSITVNAPVTYTVTWHAGTASGTVEGVSKNASLADVLSDVTKTSCDDESTVFQGWSKTQISTKTDDAPEYEETVTDDVEVYAVFAKMTSEEVVLTGGDMKGSLASNWSQDGMDTYTNAYKFNSVGDYLQSPDISAKNLKSVNVKLTAWIPSNSGSKISIVSYGADNSEIASEEISTYASSSTAANNNPVKVTLSGTKNIKYVRATMTTKGNSCNVGLDYLAILVDEDSDPTDFITTCLEKVAAPVPSVAAGIHDGAQSVTLFTTTEGATILYSLDGSTPSNTYTTALNIDESMTLKAYATKDGMADSDPVEAEYVIKYAVNAGTYSNGTIEPNLSKQEVGKKVYLPVKPDAGFELSGDLVVTGADETNIEVSVDYNGKYIIMPKQNVTYSATFVPIVATSAVVSGSSVVKVTKSIKLTVAITPANALKTDAQWKSTDAMTATVDENGNVTGVKAGDVKIYYEFKNANDATIKSNEFEIEVKDLVVDKYEEVTNASTLSAGDIVLFVKSDKTEANGNIGSGYMSKVTIANIEAVEEDVFPMVLGGNSTDGWTFSNNEGGYLAISSLGDNNKLSWTGDNRYWTITANATNCTITNKAGSSGSNTLKYNNRFSNYGSTANGVSVFKLYRMVTKSSVSAVSNNEEYGSAKLLDENEVEVENGTKFFKGEVLYLNATNNEGYEFINWTLSESNGGAEIDDVDVAETMLTVGTKPVVATANFGPKHYDVVLVNPETAGNTQVATLHSDVDKQIAGEKVTLSYSDLATGYIVTGWNVESDGGSIEVDENNQFTMPGEDVVVTATFEELPTYNITITSNNETYGLAGFVSESASEMTYYENEEVGIEVVEMDGYRFVNWTITPADALTTIADATAKETTITVKDDATITANFEVAPSHELTWYVNGSTTTVDKTVGSSILFTEPTVGIPNGYVFKGWSETEITEPQDDEPAYVTEANMPDDDKTYYAVIAKKTTSETTYTKLASNAGYSGKTYVLGAKHNDELYLFYDYEGNTSSNIYWGKCSTNYATNKPLEFSLSGSASQLAAKLKNTDVYMVALSTGRFRMSTSEANMFLCSDGTIQASSNGYVLRYNYNSGAGGMRWYPNGNTTGVAAYFYEVTPGETTYSGYCTFVKALTEIKLTGEPSKKEYEIDNSFNRAGIFATAKYNDDDEVDVTSACQWTITPQTFTAAGENVAVTVKATYEEMDSEEQTYYVTVQKKTHTLSWVDGDLQLNHDADNKKVSLDYASDYTGTLQFESSDEAVAEVSGDKAEIYVDPKAVGTTTIKVTAPEDAKYKQATAEFTLTVVYHKANPTFAFAQTSVSVNEGEAFTAPTLNYTEDITVANITWSSTKTSVATVDEAGVVTIVGLGSTKIKATFAGDEHYNEAEAEYTLTVVDPNAEVINATKLGAGTSTYGGVSYTSTTGKNITYAGSCMTNNAKAHMQIRNNGSNKEDALVVTASDKIARRVVVTFSDQVNCNNLQLYGRNSAYTSDDELFDDETRGDLLYTFEYDSENPVVEFDLPKGYRYLGFVPETKTSYVAEISISWITPNYTRVVGSTTIGTICLPKAVDANMFVGATFYKIAYKDNASNAQVTKVFFDEVDHLEAGAPYIFVPEEDATEVICYMHGTEATAQSVNGLVGTLSQVENIYNADADTYDYYIISQGMIRRCGIGEGSVKIPENRAYINMNKVPTEDAAPVPVAGRRRIALSNASTTNTGNATGMENTGADVENIQKVFINGYIYILRGEHIYDATGRLVK